MGTCTSNKNKYQRTQPNINENLKTKDNDIYDILVVGYIRNTQNEFPQINIPYEVEAICVKYYGKEGIDGSLIIEKNQIHQLKSTKNKNDYQFTSILIKYKAKLTVNEWNKNNSEGGILNILCFEDIIIEEWGHIDLDGKGYSGGNCKQNGYSYKGKSTISDQPNYGGGGGVTKISQIPPFANGWSINSANGKGAGGGYATKGDIAYYDFSLIHRNGSVSNHHQRLYQSGGNRYGDIKLTVLHLGSGGGGGPYDSGGAGGGAIKILCFGNIILKSISRITCNGIQSNGDGGCGSGGSIHIIIRNPDNLKMHKNSNIQALCGGVTNHDKRCFGLGRIRIECKKTASTSSLYKQIPHDSIKPAPYIK